MNQRTKSKLVRIIFRFKNAIIADGLISALYQALRYPFNGRERKRLELLAIKRKTEVFSPLNIKDRFTKIYEINYWEGSESRSGPGSTVDGTTNLRRYLPTLFDEFSIRTVLDAPCGDFNWMKIVTEDCDIHYIGGDIVE